jgi:hypothetical protein
MSELHNVIVCVYVCIFCTFIEKVHSEFRGKKFDGINKNPMPSFLTYYCAPFCNAKRFAIIFIIGLCGTQNPFAIV